MSVAVLVGVRSGHAETALVGQRRDLFDLGQELVHLRRIAEDPQRETVAVVALEAVAVDADVLARLLRPGLQELVVRIRQPQRPVRAAVAETVAQRGRSGDRRGVERRSDPQGRKREDVGLGARERGSHGVEKRLRVEHGVGARDAAVDERDRTHARPVDGSVADRHAQRDLLQARGKHHLAAVRAGQPGHVRAENLRPRRDDGEEVVRDGVEPRPADRFELAARRLDGERGVENDGRRRTLRRYRNRTDCAELVHDLDPRSPGEP